MANIQSNKSDYEMNILFLGYWAVNDGLSESTIKPHIETLSSFKEIDRIFYVSIERTTKSTKCSWDIPKMEHIPYYSKKLPFLLDKIIDFTVLPFQLSQLCKKKNIKKIICRSSIAGAIGYLIKKRTDIPFYVESFEPHADYMLESGVWHNWDPRYLIQKYFEKKQMLTASGIMPVSDYYKKHLEEDRIIKCSIETIPCSVNLDSFKFSNTARNNIKQKLDIKSNAVVGIYLGKFGGIYYDDEAFRFFKSCFDLINSFFLIILTPQSDDFIRLRLEENQIPKSKVWYGHVKHSIVSEYMSAADFAFSLHRKYKWSIAFSPIKNGEYWASGLPIVISEGIGDDSEIIKNEGGGLIVDFEKNLSKSELMKLYAILIESNMDRGNNQSVENARKYREIRTSQLAYNKLLFDEDF